MSDYNLYSFTLREGDILRVLREAVSLGLRPQIIINGMFYDVSMEGGKDNGES